MLGPVPLNGVVMRASRWQLSVHSAPNGELVRRAAGPLLTLAIMALVEALHLRHLPGVGLVLLLAVGYSALTGGLASGVASGALTATYCTYYYGGDGSALQFPARTVERLVIESLSIPVVVATLAGLRKRLEDLMLRERRLRTQAEARARQQKAVASLGQVALGGAEPSSLFDAAVETLASTLRVELAKVLELLPGGDELVLRAGVGWRGGVGQRVRAGEGSQAGFTLLRREPVVVEDLAAETRFRGPALLTEHGVVSGVSVVIAGREQPFGILGVHTTSRRAFSEDDVSFVQSVADLLGQAIARKRGDDALAESEQRFRQLADNVREVFYVASVDPSRMLYVSPAYEAVWGRPSATLYADHGEWMASVHPDDRRAVAEGFARRESGYVDVEYRMVRPDGTLRWIHDRAAYVHDRGQALRLVGIAEDITAQKEAEEKARRLAAAEASVRARDDVLAVVAHDLRNPLQSVAMAATLVGQPHIDAERRARHAQTILRSVDIADRLIRDLLDVARIEAGQLAIELQVLAIEPLIDEVQEQFELVARGKGLTFACEVAGGIPRVSGDHERILQAVGNLVGNAIKFTPRGGQVTVRAEGRGDVVEIAVLDTGPGIAPALLPHVFDRFWRGRPAERRGLGLGLAIAQGIAEAHGGRVQAESEVGGGSTFRLTMPAADGELAVAPSSGDRREV